MRFAEMDAFNQVKYDYSIPYRERTCSLDISKGDNFSTFKLCESTIQDGKPKLYLWGDSAGAMLYPGLDKYYGNTYEIIQRTAGGCRPYLSQHLMSNPPCRDVSSRIIQEIEKLKPNVVMLASHWLGYPPIALEDTLAALKMAGVKKIYLVGPVPYWKDSLQRQMLIEFKKDIFHRVPTRLNSGMDEKSFLINTELRILAEKNNVYYLSPIDNLCNKSGCLALIDNQLTARDDFHLTAPASEYVVSKFLIK